MKNSEILRTPKALLVALDTQRRYLLAMALEAMGCPACHAWSNLVEASGMDLDDFPVDNLTGTAFHCTQCKRRLVHDVYLYGGQGWSLAPEEAEKLGSPVSEVPPTTPTSPLTPGGQ